MLSACSSSPSRILGHRVRFLVAPIALVFLASACGAESGTPQPSDVASATATTSAAKMVDGAGLGKKLTSAALKAKTAQVKIWIGGGIDVDVVSAIADVRFTGAGAQARFTIDKGAEHLVVVALSGKVYVSGIPTGDSTRPWSRIDAGSKGRLRTWVPQIERLVAAVDSASLAVSQPHLFFTDNGTSTIPETTEYTSHLTTEQWVAAQPAGLRAQSQAWAASHSVSGADAFLFLDDGGLPQRQILTTAPSSTHAASQVDFSHWGEPVAIAAPASVRKVGLKVLLD